ncbi:uncharacterized protein LOC100145443 [Xenopus tropicalis]|uniref:LOC100145443 protein n=2 Tax=Xenopus tropicalis TaxID=8364 RepID=A0A803KGU9_XENTR|nr:uncharacterized protein LOC100145443 [Xenopus tropicalis]AAI61059.1 LOC100145443 protein [Xenopus tropicalis]|eukprot:NP_001120369.1 uncharacterized protein LOC100145443 [Xenopus tropicalis]
MSEVYSRRRRTNTRLSQRLKQDSSSMLDSDTSSAETPPLSNNASASPKVDPKLALKEEPVDPAAAPNILVSVCSLPAPSTSQSMLMQVRESTALQGPIPFPGRKRKANFSNEETETLVKYVVKHFSALYGSEALRTESTRRNQRRSQLWSQIQTSVNELGYTPRTIDDLKHKWRDLRLDVKRKITHRRTSGKASPAPTVTPIIDTKLTPLEDLVASTIGHHCSLDGEQEGMFMEPGVPRQSIFLTCRGPPSGVSELCNDTLSSTASPRPPAEISLVAPLVSASPAHVSFIPVTENGDLNELDATQRVTIKPFTEAWTTVSEICTLVTNPTPLAPQTDLVLKNQKPATQKPEMLKIKQEQVPLQNDLDSVRCDSQGSIGSSPEGSIGPVTGHNEWTSSVNGDNEVSAVTVESDTLQLKIEDDGDSQMEEDTGSQGNQEVWERQSVSPQHSDNAQDSIPPSSSSQEGEPSSGGDIVTNGDDCCLEDDGKEVLQSRMHRLLELEEHWDRLYQRELGMWEEERIRQQQQRDQDQKLQLQLMGILSDIRDELRLIREDRAAAREALLNSQANGSAVLSAAPTEQPPPAPSTVSSAPEQPTPSTPSKNPKKPSTTDASPALASPQPRRRGRPRLVRPNADQASKS